MCVCVFVCVHNKVQLMYNVSPSYLFIIGSIMICVFGIQDQTNTSLLNKTNSVNVPK